MTPSIGSSVTMCGFTNGSWRLIGWNDGFLGFEVMRFYQLDLESCELCLLSRGSFGIDEEVSLGEVDAYIVQVLMAESTEKRLANLGYIN